MWTDVFYALCALWPALEKATAEGEFLWVCRMSENGDYTVKSELREIKEDLYGIDVDSMTMGSDGKLFGPRLCKFRKISLTAFSHTADGRKNERTEE